MERVGISRKRESIVDNKKKLNRNENRQRKAGIPQSNTKIRFADSSDSESNDVTKKEVISFTLHSSDEGEEDNSDEEEGSSDEDEDEEPEAISTAKLKQSLKKEEQNKAKLVFFSLPPSFPNFLRIHSFLVTITNLKITQRREGSKAVGFRQKGSKD